MKQPLLLRAEAKAEIHEAYEWYEERRTGLGQEFLAALRETLKEVESSPLRFRQVRGDMRRAALRKFPYALYYVPEAGRTVVFACFHARRDPRVLQRRH